MAGMGLYPVEDTAGRAMQGMGSAASTFGAMGQNRTTKTKAPDKSVGGAMGSAGGMGLAGFQIGGPIGGAVGAGVGAMTYLFS